MPMHLAALFRRPSIVLGLLVASGASLLAESPTPGITIEKQPVTVERRTFDPTKPPADLPQIDSAEAGLCWAKFYCESQVSVEGPTVVTAGQPTTITSVRVKVSLKIIIWTVVNASPKLIAHEEGHREIAETYYRDAESIARTLAEKLLGRKLAQPVDGSPAMTRALNQLQEGLMTGFLAATAKRCNFAEERFDVITDHGRNSIPERDAVARALADEEKAKWKG